MRALLSWRFLAAVAALVGLAFVAVSVLANDDELAAVIEPDPLERRIDLISPVVAPIPSDDFAIGDDGATEGYLDLLLPGERTMRIAPGTPGEITCEELTEFNSCAVVADVLGDAVVFFALLPQAERQTVELAPVVDLEEGYAVFANGWRIAYAPIIERDCGDIDIPTFSDFLSDHAEGSVSILDLDAQQITTVRCGDPDADDG